jgi:hypothetical protein
MSLDSQSNFAIRSPSSTGAHGKPFHITFQPQKDDGSPIKTIDPDGKETIRHHWDLLGMNSPDDLRAKANAWAEDQKEAEKAAAGKSAGATGEKEENKDEDK